jgi:hypothetical protein
MYSAILKIYTIYGSNNLKKLFFSLIQGRNYSIVSMIANI